MVLGGARFSAGRPSAVEAPRVAQARQRRRSSTASGLLDNNADAEQADSVAQCTRSSNSALQHQASSSSASAGVHDPNSPSAMSPDTLRKSLRRTRTQRNFAMRQLYARNAQQQSGNASVRQSGAPATARSANRVSRGSSNATAESKARRRQNASKGILHVLQVRPEENNAYIINSIIMAMPVAVRNVLRSLSALRQEQFLAKRDLLWQLKAEVFTPRNALESRLENLWPTLAMERADATFSKVQSDDGSWTPRVLAPAPSGSKKSNRTLGITRPLKMCRIFAQSVKMKEQLDQVLTP
eukprot:2818139-Pleurochrysis_carterae.AAC.1